ncbi:UNVERIFIED_CONTAM: hypothetical protein FKN15_000639 [Acipenser sinensis]
MAVWGSLLLVLLMSTRSQGLLSDFKKCGDAECESLISRVQAIRDHKGPDCRFLNFKSGAVIFVYYKLAGQRDDLWAGSIDKQFGYFPRDAVEIEEVYVSNEVQIPAKETDFFCLDGSGYFTESESSHLESQEPHKPEVPASEQNENVDSGKGEPGDSAEQLGQVNKDLKVAEQEGSRWLGSRVTGWLGLGSQEDDGEQKKAEQLSFKSRKIAMDFNDNAFKSDIDKETEPKETGWLSGSLSNLMNFRGQAPEVLANNKPENADDKITAQHRKKETMTNTGEAGETEIEHNSQEEKAASDGSKSNWLNIGISDVLSFSRNSWNGNSKPKDGTLKEKYDGQVEDDKISSDGEQELNREETSTQIGEQRSIVPNTEKKDSTSHPDKETVEGEMNMKGGKTGWEEMSGQREVHFLKDAESTAMALDIQEPDLGEEVKLAEMQRSLKSLEEEAIGLKSQMEQAQTTLKIYQINSERLQTNLQAAKEENCQLQESKAQLVQEAEGWDERLNELAEQIKMCEESQKDMQEDCSNKDEQIKLHAGLKSIEEDKNRIFTKLADEEKAKEDLKGMLLRQRAKDLEEERERTNQAYKNQIASHEKKAHDNWLAARAAERDLNEIKRENSHLRQRLTDSQFKLEMVEKDPYALDVPGRPQFRGERSPFGPSPLGRPASETRAFLSPPTLMDGPPRVSPAFPGVPGGRASRGPPNHAAHPVLSESLDPNCDRNFDNYSTHSDSGSLSPTWERERRVHVPPPGYPYPDPTFPYRRPPPERGYPMPPPSGRLSGPAEIRGYSPLSAVRGPPPPGMFPRFPPPQLHPGYPPARYPTESASGPPPRPSPPTSEQPGEHAAPPPQDII